METHQLEEIINCLPNDRTVFRYAKDDYAAVLLSRYVGEGRRMSDVRKSIYGKLLDKPLIKSYISSLGRSSLVKYDLDMIRAKENIDFILTLAKWNCEQSNDLQTTRNSANLVLQMNFNAGHMQEFNRFIGSTEETAFYYDSHPVHLEKSHGVHRHTLAWARLDVDLDSGAVLIEEIQNDWLRFAARYLRRVRWRAQCRPALFRAQHTGKSIASIEWYVQNILEPYKKIWDEAMLAATINFCFNELGVVNIYYHNFHTGTAIKRMFDSKPPRSLYSALPRKFCFVETRQTPCFLAKSRVVRRKLKKIKNIRWQQLNIN